MAKLQKERKKERGECTPGFLTQRSRNYPGLESRQYECCSFASTEGRSRNFISKVRPRQGLKHRTTERQDAKHNWYGTYLIYGTLEMGVIRWLNMIVRSGHYQTLTKPQTTQMMEHDHHGRHTQEPPSLGSSIRRCIYLKASLAQEKLLETPKLWQRKVGGGQIHMSPRAIVQSKT